MITVSDLANCSLNEIIERIKSGERAGSAWDSTDCDPIQDMIDAYWRPLDEFSPFPQRYMNKFVEGMTGLSHEEIKDRANTRTSNGNRA